MEECQQEFARRTEMMLRTVLRIVARSAANGAALQIVLDRLRALDATYALLSLADRAEVSLANLAASQLGVRGIASDGRITVEGPPVPLSAKAAIVLGMVLHELATTALRHGALSLPQGRVHLGWEIEPHETAGACLAIRWRESGGPSIEISRENGYIDELIENELTRKTGAIGTLTFGGGGLLAALTLPLSGGPVSLTYANGSK
jgi:two-component sensor histidine kinase